MSTLLPFISIPFPFAFHSLSICFLSSFPILSIYFQLIISMNIFNYFFLFPFIFRSLAIHFPFPSNMVGLFWLMFGCLGHPLISYNPHVWLATWPWKATHCSKCVHLDSQTGFGTCRWRVLCKLRRSKQRPGSSLHQQFFDSGTD